MHSWASGGGLQKPQRKELKAKAKGKQLMQLLERHTSLKDLGFILTSRDKTSPMQEAGTETSSESSDPERPTALVKGRKLSKIHPVGQRRKQASLNAWACGIRRQNFLKFWPNTSCEFENLSVHFLCGLGNILTPTSPPGKNLHEYWSRIGYPWDCSGETCTQWCRWCGILTRSPRCTPYKKALKDYLSQNCNTYN